MIPDQVERFSARGEDGKRRTVVKTTSYFETASLTDPSSPPQAETVLYQTVEDGTLTYVGPGLFRSPTGMLLRSSDPRAM